MKSSIFFIHASLAAAGLISAGILAAAVSGFAAEGTAAAGAPILRVGVTANSPPMIFKQGASMAGMEADFARALARELGREVRFVEVPRENLIDQLEQGKIDIIMSSMSVTRARQFRVTFSDPYLRIAQMAMIRADEQSLLLGWLSTALAKQAIGVKQGTTADLVVQQDFPKAKRKFYKTGDEAAKALKKGSIDLYISDSTMVWHLAANYEAQGLVVAPMTFSDEVLAWGMNRSDAQLPVLVNEFLRKLRASGELDRIVRRWIPKFQ